MPRPEEIKQIRIKTAYVLNQGGCRSISYGPSCALRRDDFEFNEISVGQIPSCPGIPEVLDRVLDRLFPRLLGQPSGAAASRMACVGVRPTLGID